MGKNKKNEVTTSTPNNNVANAAFGLNQLLTNPGDVVKAEKMPGGDIVARLDTKNRKATARQYMKKDGTPGKITVVDMEPNKK